MGDGLICTSGKARELYTETVLPKVLEGRGEAGAERPEYARMIEVKVSFDTDMKRAMEDTRHWAVLALTPEEKISVHTRHARRKATAQAASACEGRRDQRDGLLPESRDRTRGNCC